MQFLPLRRRDPSCRGQALAEFALILPLIALLLVMSLDFGRVFFGWVALQNAARIAADNGAMNADLWSDPSNALVRSRYQTEVNGDLQALNCAPGPIKDPTFTDIDGDGDKYGHGDRASASLECTFTLITPLAQNILGGGVKLGTVAHFPVHKTIWANVPDPPNLPENDCEDDEAEVPQLIGKSMQDAKDAWVAAGFDGANFTPPVVTTGPGNNKNKIVVTQSTIPIGNVGDCIADDASVTVTHS